MLNLNNDEKKVLNTLFKDVRHTTRNEMIYVLYAAKPEPTTPDAEYINLIINPLIQKIYDADPKEMTETFDAIPFDID
ncbi:hypothetical protein HMP0721_0808 [Pseudoramibacter alactolyticus ATCC 23263]|uniref:Uncharacterized protein n=1 Tax=Pseudoramibacter alactolyticus ATCC 23263 TaxID=887929 RepID=E6MFP7_9FIRM|nr:hypothetical protein [Pseudoramibacter alactolyticus]EFV02042.1 hypothetical protein HMP0721_0808 [Pseudoramibacter alactolyticus ATCC 23263]